MKKLLIIFVVLFSLLSTKIVMALQSTFIPRFRVNAEYTDNLFLGNGQPGIPLEKEEEDIITTLSAGFTAGLTGKYAGLSLSYDPAYAFYEEFEENDGWRHRASLDSYLDLTKNTRFELTDSFLLTEDPLSEEQIAAIREGEETGRIDPTIRTTREQYWRNTARARLTQQFGRDDSLYAEYIYSILENDDPEFEDSQDHTGSAGLTYYFGPKWGAGISGYYTKGTFDQAGEFTGTSSDDFDEWGGNLRLIRRFSRTTDGYLQYNYNTIDFDGDEEDYQTHDTTIGFNYAVEEDISLSASTGYFVQKLEDSDDEDGTILNLSLAKTLRRGGYRLEVGTGYDNVFFTAENLGFNVHYRAGFTADYELFRRFRGDIYGAYRFEDYRRQTPEREDDIYRAGGGITWIPALWANIRLGYSFRRVDSTESTNDYEENRVLLTFSFSPEQPYRKTY
jgi:hypothetical protein